MGKDTRHHICIIFSLYFLYFIILLYNMYMDYIFMYMSDLKK